MVTRNFITSLRRHSGSSPTLSDSGEMTALLEFVEWDPVTFLGGVLHGIASEWARISKVVSDRQPTDV